MKIQEVCLYNTGVLCGGAGERLGKCWRCGWNPECVCRRKQAKLNAKPKSEPKKAKVKKVIKLPARMPQESIAMYYYKLGYKDKGIADKCHCNYREITHWRILKGLPPNTGPKKTRPREYDWEKGMELYRQGKSNIEIAEKLGCTKATVGKHFKSAGLERNKKGRYDWGHALNLHSEGKTDKQIAISLGCTPEAVYQWRRRNNLPKNGVS